MVLVCRKCKSPNPDQARFCHYDGENLTGLAPIQPPPPRPPAAGVPAWAKWLGVAGLAIVVVMAAGYVSGWLAVLIAIASLGLAGWRIQQGQVWRRPDWWRIGQHEHPRTMYWSLGAAVGMALSLGIFGFSRAPEPVENASVPGANDSAVTQSDPAIATGTAPSDPAIVPVEASNPSPPESAWSGVWQSESLGTLQFQQEGDQIQGVYDRGPGRLIGRPTGRTLKGTWSNPEGEGEVELTLSPDGRSFSGKYNYGTGLSWYEDDFFSGRRP
jgi:hypothetical protein